MTERRIQIIAGVLAVAGLVSVWQIINTLWAHGWSMHVIHLVAISAAAFVAFAATFVVLMVVLHYRRELERKNEELRQLEQLKDDLTHMIVHDLKNPLMGITGFAQLALNQDNLPVDLREYLQRIGDSGQTMLRIITNLLDITKLEEARMELHPEEFPVAEAFQEAIREMSILAALEKGHITVSVSPEDLTIRADRGLVERVLVNLLNNAFKHTPAPGQFRLSAALTPRPPSISPNFGGEEGAGEGDEPTVTLSVSDNGEGIPPEFHTAIFDRFKQAGLRPLGRKLDTGLGLTFCKMVAEAHGGRIWVESAVGQGSTFFLTLPAGQTDLETLE
jgi:signal transduction histidine kinase